jgi:hypothetical protein
LKLLKFLNDEHVTGNTQDEWRNAVMVPIFRRGYKRDQKHYRRISFLNTYYKMYAKVLDKKLEKYSE